MTPIKSFHSPSWFALKVRVRSEQAAQLGLCSKGIRCYLPLHRERRRYTDRMKTVEAAMFPGYLFCQVTPEHLKAVLSVPVVQYLVGDRDGPTPIPDQEMASLQKVVSSGAAEPTPYPEKGLPVRVRVGNLDDISAIVLRRNSKTRLVVSVELLCRSVALEVDEDQVEFL
jgi:transcription antitermination factor NusG